MDLWRIAVRAVVAYIYLLFMTRASGKCVVSQATPFDFVLALILGDLVDDVIWAEVSVAKFAGGAGAVFMSDLLTKAASYYSQRVDALVEGIPRTVLRHGRKDSSGLRREQLNDEDLSHLLRLRGIGRRSDLDLALVERDSQLSVIRKPEKQPATKKDAPKVKKMLR